jgi:uncharacterized protein with FMN-binding domain
MPKRGLIAFLLSLAALRLIVAYSPPGGDIGSGDTESSDPSTDPVVEPSTKPTASATAGATEEPVPTELPTGSLKDGTYDGEAIRFKYGTAQVEIVVSGGVITEVKALKLPTSGGYTKRVTNFFKTEVPARIIADQGWKISNVGGATYTSRAYAESLQSAINQAS